MNEVFKEKIADLTSMLPFAVWEAFYEWANGHPMIREWWALTFKYACNMISLWVLFVFVSFWILKTTGHKSLNFLKWEDWLIKRSTINTIFIAFIVYVAVFTPALVVLYKAIF